MPSEKISSANDGSMRKPLSGDKLRNIAEMYESYVPRDRWPVQLVEALKRPHTEIEDNMHVPANSQYDAQAIRVGALLGASGGAARVHTYLRRVEGASNLSDDVLAERCAKRRTLVLGLCRVEKEPVEHLKDSNHDRFYKDFTFCFSLCVIYNIQTTLYRLVQDIDESHCLEKSWNSLSCAVLSLHLARRTPTGLRASWPGGGQPPWPKGMVVRLRQVARTCREPNDPSGVVRLS